MMAAGSSEKIRCCVIGSGRVAQSFLRALEESAHPGFISQGMYARSADESGISGGITDVPADAALIYIAVSDDAIEMVARQLGGLAFSGKPIFLHASGARGLEVLNPLRKKGFVTGSAHPVQSFPEGAGPDVWKGITVSLLLDEEADTAVRLFESLGSHVLRVTPEQKKQLHIAAVFASNYLVTLMQAAGQAAPDLGPEVHRILRPLVRSTMDNTLEKGPLEALTGPLRRGDTGTVEAHLNRLKNQPETEQFYRQLGLYTAEWLNRESRLDEQTFERLKSLFQK